MIAMNKPLLPALLLSCLFAFAGLSAADAAPAAKLERVVLIYRHGVRAPLPGEAAAAADADAPWPDWGAPPTQLTTHGREAVRLSGVYLRDWLLAEHLLQADACPVTTQVTVWANTDQRTIDSGEILASALAPGCGIATGHLPLHGDDPLFSAVSAGVMDFDAKQAIASIEASNGGPAALVARHAQQLQAMKAILGCDDCSFMRTPSLLAASGDGHGLVLKGPIDLTSGTGEVFLLQYAQGMPLAQVGWGRADMQRLEAVSRLHALLFEVYARPHYMALRSGGPLARRALELLGDPKAPAVSIFVGSDNHIAGVTSLLGAHFQINGFGADDPPPGGALAIELWREPGTGKQEVRVEYLAQSLQQLRDLQPLDLAHPPVRRQLQMQACGGRSACTLDAFEPSLETAALRR